MSVQKSPLWKGSLPARLCPARRGGRTRLPDSSFCPPRRERLGSGSLGVAALMDGIKHKYSHLGSAVRCLLKNCRFFFFFLRKKHTGNFKFLPTSSGSETKPSTKCPGSCWWHLRPETAGFGGGESGKICLGGSLLPSSSYLKTQEQSLVAGLNRNYFPPLALDSWGTAPRHKHLSIPQHSWILAR